MKLSATAVGVPPLAAPRRPAPSTRSEDCREERVDRVAVDGLTWTCRGGFQRVLTAVPSETWSDPGRQGWRRIKHNSTREVWRARIGDENYYLKYYARHRWIDSAKSLLRGSTCEAEWNGGLYSLKAGIAAVRPAGFTAHLRGPRRGWSLLVTESIEPAYPLNEFWTQLRADTDPIRRRQDAAQTIELLAELIARAHQAGFEHLDMHAANILIQPLAPRRYRALLVDLHSARLGVPIGDAAVVRNLAQLNQWFRKNSGIGDRLRFLRAYLRWRNEYEQAFEHARPLGLSFEELVSALIASANRHARSLWAQRDRRTGRDGRYFGRVTTGGGWRGMVNLCCKHPQEESRASSLVFATEWWRTQLARPLSLVGGEGAQACKNSHSAQVWRTRLAHPDCDLPVIVKRPLARNWLRRLRLWIGPSRSLRAWKLGHALLHRDIPTARPLAVLERRVGPLVVDSLLITEALPGASDLRAHLQREHSSRSRHGWVRHKRELSMALVEQLRRLSERGIHHRDCKAENILVLTRPHLRLIWIDLDGLRLQRHLTRSQRLRPLMRLHVSLLDIAGLTRTDRARFLKAYFARYGDSGREWRTAWRELSRAAERKVVARENRRAWKLSHYGRA